jgi:hypothetical protein
MLTNQIKNNNMLTKFRGPSQPVNVSIGKSIPLNVHVHKDFISLISSNSEITLRRSHKVLSILMMNDNGSPSRSYKALIYT